MVVIYRVSRLMAIEAKIVRFKRPRYFALPNILLGRSAVAELIQEAATPEAIADAVSKLLVDGPERAAQLAEFREMEVILGSADAITQTARLANELIRPVQ
jgi:lipid-A-disaccharide synthase